jgi:hypothetical protein
MIKNKIHHRLITGLGLEKYAFAIVQRLLFIYYNQKINTIGKPILLFQMGKVGSQTVEKTLNSLELSRPVFHFHWLSPDMLKFTLDKSDFLRRAYPGRDYWESVYVKEKILPSLPSGNVDIITLTREPIARNLSAFFYSWGYWYPDMMEKFIDLDSHPQARQQLTDYFLQKFHHQRALDWFDVELAPYFDFDIYQEPFSPEKGYQIYQTRKLNLLLIRLEDLNRCLQLALEDFFDMSFPDYQMRTKNLSQSREYNHLYKDFLKTASLPREYVDEMYNSRYARFFYTESELNGFRDHWTTD